MGQILVQISDEMLEALEKVAPASSRQRSRFIRLALTRALMEVADVRTQEAYRRFPDHEPEWFDARVWDDWKPRRTRRRRKRKTTARA